jgi:hypothetical protein
MSDEQFPAVKLRDNKVEAAKRLGQANGVSHDEVVTRALELFMRLGLQHDNDVARLDAGLLIALATQIDLLAVAHALVDVHLNHLGLVVDLLASARRTPVLLGDDLALPTAVGADALDLLGHAGAELPEGHLAPTASAPTAWLRCPTTSSPETQINDPFYQIFHSANSKMCVS